MTYDLRADVRAILDSSDLSDPGEIADKVVESLRSRDLRDALRITMRGYVRNVIAETRTPTAVALGPGKGSGWKVSGIRDGWQRVLQNRVHVGDSEWKLLGDCTYDNLHAIAAEREQNAAKNAAWARHYRALAALLTEHDAATVRDLPAEVLMPALGAVA